MKTRGSGYIDPSRNIALLGTRLVVSTSPQNRIAYHVLSMTAALAGTSSPHTQHPPLRTLKPVQHSSHTTERYKRTIPRGVGYHQQNLTPVREGTRLTYHHSGTFIQNSKSSGTRCTRRYARTQLTAKLGFGFKFN